MTAAAESAPSIAYLGPAGTFHEQALLSQPDLLAGELVPLPTIVDVLNAAESGDVDLGFAAIENSIEGTVNITLDTLAFEAELFIQREVIISVVLDLLVQPGVRLADVKRVVSFPHAVAQCRGFLHAQLPDVEIRAATSTAEAARVLAHDGDPHTAAIANRLAGEVYGLTAIADDIEDHPENETRFVLVRPNGIPAPTGHDKTSIVTFQRDDRPGSLLGILQEFAARSINLTKLESRPTKQALGNYCFIMDFEGHIADELVADCLKNIRAKHADVRFLGSYHAAGDHTGERRAETAAALTEAETWLRDLRDTIG